MTSEASIKSKVALVPCASYDDAEVLTAMKSGLELLGGTGAFVKAGEKIVLKPNVLIGSAPDKCVCTHPAVLKAAGKMLLETGAEVTCGDSSGFGGSGLNMTLSGLKQVADELGIPLADFSHGRVVMHKEALLNHRFTIANGVLDADGLIILFPAEEARGQARGYYRNPCYNKRSIGVPSKTKPWILQHIYYPVQRRYLADKLHGGGHDFRRRPGAAEDHHDKKEQHAYPLGGTGGGDNRAEEKPEAGKTYCAKHERNCQQPGIDRPMRVISYFTQYRNQYTASYNDNKAYQQL